MTPYYQDDFCEIHCGDAREVCSRLAKADLLLTDPPYGIGYDARGGGGSAKSLSLAKRTVFKKPVVAGDDRGFDPAWMLGLAERQMIWGAHIFFSKLPPGRLLVWKKRESPPGSKMCFADGEACWDSAGGLMRVLSHTHNGFVRDLGDCKKPVHPTQKPIRVMEWCLGFAGDAETVIDPYMGSGSTLVACKKLGRRAVGVELEEFYCEQAAIRLRSVSHSLTPAQGCHG